jgi:branched-chain amino acid transport system permease protein
MNSYALHLAELAAINCMLALGAYVSLSSGLMVVCFGAVMSVGGIAGAAAYSAGAPYFVAALIGGIVGAVCGGIICSLCAPLTRFMFAMATIALGELGRVIAVNTEVLGGALGYKNVRPDPSVLYSIGILAVFLAVFRWYEHSPFRTAVHLVKNNDVAASGLGIDVAIHRVAAVVAASFLVGVSGCMYIHSVGLLDPKMYGFENSVQILVFALVGGTAGYAGPLLGAVALTVLPELLRFSTSARMLLYGLALVVVMAVRPEGLITLRLPIKRKAAHEAAPSNY